MCGILVIYGDNPERELKRLIKKLNHRGPDSTGYFIDNKVGMAFCRLSINDTSALGMQPTVNDDYVTMINGEIYNHLQLKEKYQLKIIGKSDTHVVGPLFEKLREDIIHHLDGFYSGVIFNKKTCKIFTLRDYIGKKGLFLVRNGSSTIITSELKAISHFDSFQVIPKGVCEIDLFNGTMKVLNNHRMSSSEPTKQSLYEILTDAVEKRIPKNNIPFGVFLSGGLDSSILAKIIISFKANAKFYLLADKYDSLDYQPGKTVLACLNIANARIVPLPTAAEIPGLIKHVVRITESYNPSIISNGICSYLLSKAAKEDKLKVCISGEGADEMFGGYHFLEQNDDWKSIRSKLLEDMHFTELRRLDLTCMDNSIEVRCPYLDRAIYEYSQALNYEDLYSDVNSSPTNKYILRKAFESELPQDIIWRKKVSSDVGSGIRKIVVNYLLKNYKNEKLGLLDIWKSIYRHKPTDRYFHSYPSFDAVIEKRGGIHKQ